MAGASGLEGSASETSTVVSELLASVISAVSVVFDLVVFRLLERLGFSSVVTSFSIETVSAAGVETDSTI